MGLSPNINLNWRSQFLGLPGLQSESEGSGGVIHWEPVSGSKRRAWGVAQWWTDTCLAGRRSSIKSLYLRSASLRGREGLVWWIQSSFCPWLTIWPMRCPYSVQIRSCSMQRAKPWRNAKPSVKALSSAALCSFLFTIAKLRSFRQPRLTLDLLCSLWCGTGSLDIPTLATSAYRCHHPWFYANI